MQFLKEPYRKIKKFDISWKLNVIPLYMQSRYRSWQNSRPFDDIKTLCVFIGHGRSGHSIIGALLDAHPHAIVSDEVNTLRYFAAGFSKNQLYHLMWARSRKEAEKGRVKPGRAGQMASYKVPNQWQGRFKKLEVIGDSRAGASTGELFRDPDLLHRLQEKMNVNIKFIHIIRNPFDNISTKTFHNERGLALTTASYFKFSRAIVNLQSYIPSDNYLCLRHEDLLDFPKKFLTELCAFVGLESTPDYLDDCAGIIYKSPAKSRHKIEWSNEAKKVVQSQICEFDFLARYSFDS